jgi:hypothetical protein
MQGMSFAFGCIETLTTTIRPVMIDKSRFARHCLPALVAISILAPASAGDTWPSFQNGGRMSLELPDAPANWVLSEEITWNADLLGYGQSSPVVWGGQVYVTSVEGANKETYHIAAYDVGDGTKLWQHAVINASPVKNSNYVSRAAPTPAADANGLICFFEGGNLVSLTHKGDVRWERSLVDDYGAISGLAASVEQDETAAYIWVERSENPYVLSVNKQTGKTNWKVDGLGATSWASPRIVPVGNSGHLVLSGIGSLVGLDLGSGERRWKLDGISGNSSPTPVPLGEGRFLMGATVGRGESGSSKASESNGVVAISKSDDGAWRAKYVWRAKRATSSFGSPIAHNGTAYFVNRSGVLFGLDLANGEEQFNKRLPGSTWATPAGVGNRVLFFGKDGRVSVLSGNGRSVKLTKWEALPSDPEPKQGKPQGRFSGGVLYGAAWCDDMLLLRRGDQLFAVATTHGK